MEPFITFVDTDKNNELQYYILQRAFPHYIGVVLDYQKDDAIEVAMVSGHRLYVTYAGTIQGNYVLSRNDLKGELRDTFAKMAEWFYINRVLKQSKRYKKWKL